MKKILYITGFILVSVANAQQPFINSLDKTFGTANEVVTISGSGFVDTPGVYFGNGKSASVTFINENLILATVPSTATYGAVTVANSNGMQVSSSQLFVMSFDKDFAGETFTLPAPETAIPTDQGFTYDLCLCDFNTDGLLDAVVTNNEGGSLSIMTNTSSSGMASLSLSSFATENTNTTHNIECADLNADEKPDLVITSSASGEPYVHIYENTSSGGAISFTRRARIELSTTFNSATRQPKRVRLADIDGDGKPDIIVGNVLRDDNTIIIFLNQSTVAGNVTFSPTEQFVLVPNATHTGAIYSGDFDNDGKIDLAVLPSRQGAENIYLLKNNSLPGAVSFTSMGSISAGTAERVNLIVADFNNDGLNDIAATKRTGATDGGSLEIFQNDGNFTFISGGEISSGEISPWGIDAGDMNGDGLVDIVMGSLSDEVVYLENTTPSVGANITFSSIVIENAGDAVRNVRIGDLNDDGKPDIAFTNNSVAGQDGDFQYIINNGCMTPVITPSSGTFCNPMPTFELMATRGQNITYAWDISGGITASIPMDATGILDISQYAPGGGVEIMVSLTSTMLDGCSRSIGPFTYTQGDTPPAAPIISGPSGVICLGDDNITLTASTNISGTYTWNGPGGFSVDVVDNNTINISAAWFSENLTTADNGVESIMAGAYSVFIQGADCRSEEGTFNFIVSGPPVTSIEVINCNADAGVTTLEVPDFSSQFAYQWKLDGADVGTDIATYSATTTGSYTLDITDDNGCTYTSEAVVIRESSFTGPQFSSVGEVCVGVEANFSADQTGTGVTWEVDDPNVMGIQTFNENTLNYTFERTGTATVSLFTSYADGIGCSSRTITVSDDPVFTIPDTMVKCSSDNVTISLTDASTSGGDSWTWTDVINDPPTDLSASANGDLVTALVGTYTATYTSSTGCQTTTPPIVVTDFDGIGVTSSESTFEGSGLATTIAKNDTLIFGEEQIFVTLTAANSSAFTWATSSRPEDLDNTNTSTVVVTPSAPIVTVTVSGQTLDGCMESTNIVIMSGRLIARKSFSPNDDALNDFWTINNSRNLNGCKVIIFDSQGAVISRGDSPFDNDKVWDGNYKGSPVPEGVYYFVLKCDESDNNQAGSILLAR